MLIVLFDLFINSLFKDISTAFLASLTIMRIPYIYDYFFKYKVGVIINNEKLNCQENKYLIKLESVNTTINVIGSNNKSLSIGRKVKLNNALEIVTNDDLFKELGVICILIFLILFSISHKFTSLTSVCDTP
jgi:hypothetical protein